MGVKENIMKMIRKRLNDTKTDQRRQKGDKFMTTDKMNVHTGERLAIPVVCHPDQDSSSKISQSEDSTPDKSQKKDHKESSKTAKFLDQILLEDQDDLSKEKAKWDELYKMISDKGPNNQEVV